MSEQLAPLFESRETRLGRLPEQARIRFQEAEKTALDSGNADFADKQFVSFWLSHRTGLPRRDVLSSFDNLTKRYFGEGVTAAGAYDAISKTYQREGQAVESSPEPQDGGAEAIYAQTEGLPKATKSSFLAKVGQGMRAMGAGFEEVAQQVPAGFYSQAATVTGAPGLLNPMEDDEYRALKLQNAKLLSPYEFSGGGGDDRSFGPVLTQAEEELIAKNEARMTEIVRGKDAVSVERVKEWSDSIQGDASKEFRNLSKFWYELSKGASERMGVNPEFERTAVGGFMKSAGSVPATAALAVLGPAGWAGMESLFFAQVEAERMGKEGADYDPETAVGANLASALPQAIMERAFGTERFLNKVLGELPKMRGRVAFGDFVKGVVRTGLASGTEEGITEPAQNFWNDYIASLSYDEKRELFTAEAGKQRLVESVSAFALGFVFGGGISTVETIDRNRAVGAGERYLLTKDGQPLETPDFDVLRQTKTDKEIMVSAPDVETGKVLVAAANGDKAAQADYNNRVKKALFKDTEGVEVEGAKLGTVNGVPAFIGSDGMVISLDVGNPEHVAFMDEFKRRVVEQVTTTDTLAQMKERFEENLEVSQPAKLATLQERVASGQLTQEQADDALAVAKDINGLAKELTLADVRPEGSATVRQTTDGIWKMVVEVAQSSDPTKAIEEVSEAYIHRAYKTQNLLPADLQAARLRWHEANGETDAAAAFQGDALDRANIEWFSKRVIDYALANRKTELPGGWGKWLRTLGEQLKRVLGGATRMRKLMREGKLDAELESWMKGALGITAEGDAFGQTLDNRAGQMDEANEANAPTVGELDEEMMATAQADETFPKIERNDAGEGYLVSSPEGRFLGSRATMEEAQDLALAWFDKNDRMQAMEQAREESGEVAENELMQIMKRHTLPAPSMAGVFRGEMQALYENMTLPQRLRIFRTKEMDLDMTRQAVNEDGFNFETVSDFLDALDKSSRGIPVFGNQGAGEQQVTFGLGRAVPEDASNVVKMPDGAQLVGPTTFAIKAYHGTPHKVDRFSTAKIGTGEGAQVFGWGLYFAENAKVAREYQKNLAGLYNSSAQSRDGQRLPLWVYRALTSGRLAEVKQDFEDRLKTAIENGNSTHEEGAKEVLKGIAAYEQGTTFESGNFYTVELLPNETDFLDFDNPLGEYDPVTKKVNALFAKKFGYEGAYFQGGMSSGGLFYQRLSKVVSEKLGKLEDFGPQPSQDEQRAGSEFMREAGIPGIRYLDNFSRQPGTNKFKVRWNADQTGAEVADAKTDAVVQSFKSFREADAWVAQNADKPTYNYVIFDDSLVQILEENGQKVEMEQVTFGFGVGTLTVEPSKDAWGKPALDVNYVEAGGGRALAIIRGTEMRLASWGATPLRAIMEKGLKAEADFKGKGFGRRAILALVDEGQKRGVKHMTVFAPTNDTKAVMEHYVEKGWFTPGKERDLVGFPESFTINYDAIREEAEPGSITFSLAAPSPVFYSRVIRTVEQSTQNKASGAQWKATIRNSKLGVNKDEFALVGVSDLEDGKTYTKAEVLDYLRANEVKVQDVTLGGGPDEAASARLKEINAEYRTLTDQLSENRRQREEGLITLEENRERVRVINARKEQLMAETEILQGDAPETHFSSYTLPGAIEGSYREVLLTVPEDSGLKKKTLAEMQEWWRDTHGVEATRYNEALNEWVPFTEPELRQAIERSSRYHGADFLEKLTGAKRVMNTWRDGHSQYSDIPNPIVRLRYNERVTTDGKRMLFLEEVQGPQKQEFEKMPELFQKNWREIGFKWALRKAVDGGFDVLGWTTGDQQAERYDLSKALDHIDYWKDGDDYGIQALDKNGTVVFREEAVSLNRIEEVAGKGIAKRVGETATDQPQRIKEEGLKVGGEGLRKLYDSDFRNVVNGLAVVKKTGQKVGTASIGQEKREWSVDHFGDNYFVQEKNGTMVRDGFSSAQEAFAWMKSIPLENTPVHSLDLTSDIKGGAMQGQTTFALAPATESKAFKEWFGDSKVVDAQGKPLVVYHGARRADRVGKRFRKDRATSGPMAFFTTNPEVASGYASGKADTSMEMPADYSEWFKYKAKGSRSGVSIDRAWWTLTPEERTAINQKIYTVGYENADSGEGQIVGNSSSIMGGDSIDYELRQARGNGLKALVEIWLNSGSLFNDEMAFLDVLKAAGVDMSKVNYDNPHDARSGVFPVYLRIRQPFDTAKITKEDVAAFEQASKRKRSKQAAGGNPDAWDKNTVSGKEWMERLNEDAKNGTTHAWTVIPDWVTETLQSRGYDGIKDTGGKYGGDSHSVFIPFNETQVKSATGNRGTFDPTNADITFATTGIPQNQTQSMQAQIAAIRSKQLAATAAMTAAVAKGPLPKRAAQARRGFEASWLTTVFTPLTGRLGDVSQKVLQRSRRFEVDLAKSMQADFKQVEPFLKGFESMRDADFAVLDLALKNGDTDTRDVLLTAYNLTNQFAQVEILLEQTRQRAKAAGFEVGMILNYFPRKVNDYEKLHNFYYGTPAQGVIEKAVTDARKKAHDAGVVLSQEQETMVINNAIQRFVRPTGSKPSNLKGRVTDVVSVGANEFYATSTEALLGYIQQINQAVEKRRFFGKHAVTMTTATGGKYVSNALAVKESVGGVVGEMLAAGEITPAQQEEVQVVMTSRFAQASTPQFVRDYKSLVYLTTMGQFTSAITQLGDTMWSLYESGFYETAAAFAKSAGGKSKITREDLGIEQLGEEFREVGKLAKLVDGVFKFTGLSHMDRMGKETLINAKFAAMSRDAKAGNLSAKDRARIDSSFEPAQAAQVIADLVKGKRTADTDFLLWSVLADYQPISLLDYPTGYLDNPRFRLFYTLKTYSIKHIESLRREAVSQMVHGNKAQKIQGGTNLLKIAGLFFMIGMPVDWIKDWLMMRDPQMGTIAVDNLFKLFGLSRWGVWQFRNEDQKILAVFKMIAPPVPFLDYPLEDLTTVEDRMTHGEAVEFADLESIRMIPFAGGPMYWGAGAGAKAVEKRIKKREDIEMRGGEVVLEEEKRRRREARYQATP
jgi:GNAT superfamily N-acetyltransferase